MDRELRRTPARFRRVARRTVRTDTQLLVIRIRRLVEVVLMAAYAFHRRTRITICMAVHTCHRRMRSRQGEVRRVVIECTIGCSGRVASQTGTAGIIVACNPHMLGVCVRLIVFVTIDATDDGEVACIGVAGSTGVPGTLMGSGVNGKILGIVIKSSGTPSGFRVAGGTVGGETGRSV